MSRRAKIEQLLQDSPEDTFLLYGLALECLKEGDDAAGRAGLEKVVAVDPKYVPAYFQMGQHLSQAGATPAAREWLHRGIAVARQVGDRHAEGEMEQFLAML